jgi:hypothetical protein
VLFRRGAELRRFSWHTICLIPGENTAFPEEAKMPILRWIFCVATAGQFLLAASCGTEEKCYSPHQNLDLAYSDGAVGCACDPERDEPVCANDGQRKIGLVCDNDRWKAVEDGPCMPSAQ